MRSFLFGCLFAIVALCSIGFGVLYFGLYPVNADTTPFWLEKKLAHMAVDAYVDRQTDSLEIPMTATPEVLLEGMKAFKSNCAGCHGSPTHKDTTFAYALYPRAPQIGVKGTHGKVKETFWITKHGIRMSGMPAFGSMLSDDQIWKIGHFLDNLEKLPADVKQLWESAERF